MVFSKLRNEALYPRKKKKVIEPGPVVSEEGVPYDYIVIIDSGSKGSRVFVYNWLNPIHALHLGHDFAKFRDINDFKLVKKYSIRDYKKGDDISDSENESEDEQGSSEKNKDQNKHKSKKPKTSEVVEDKLIRLPKITIGEKWHRKSTPGISSFNASPQKIGKHHLKYLLKLASSVVPKSQHSRTPIFLHSTAGMRLLTPTEQQQILDNICSYISSNSDFYIPECASHINVIDGDVEGLYGWLSINYLIGALDNPQDHQHGKNHTTYGLLDMGGASTQVVFQPNSSEINEHQNNLYKISLTEIPRLVTVDETAESKIGKYKRPSNLEFNVYSDSFLGFGMFQAHNRYLSFLIDNYRKEHNVGEQNRYYGGIGTPVPDPCLPKGYTTTSLVEEYSVDFTGESNFQKCLTSIFPVLLNSTYSAGKSSSDTNCKQFSESNEVSSCLLNDLIPAFDFDVNHFIGVSGYWDAITNLLSYDNKDPGDNSEEYVENKIRTDGESKNNDSTDTYDYNVIYKETSKLCSQSFSKLIELNEAKSKEHQMAQDELSELCFKSSWILNFLHLGLGFPRFGIDDFPNQNKEFKSLQLAEKPGGSLFSWTLGRAILYANDEYVQAFNNYSIEALNITDEDSRNTLLGRPGFYHSASSSVFHYGAEQNGVSPRPDYIAPREGAKNNHFDNETDIGSDSNESKWYIEPHRWYGLFIFMFLLGFILWLMLGKGGRSILFDKIKNKIRRIFDPIIDLINGRNNQTYTRLSVIDNERGSEDGGFELDNLESQSRKNNSSSDEVDTRFRIDSDDD